MTAKLSKSELLYRLVWGFHPTPPAIYRDENWMAGKGIKLHLIIGTENHRQWALASDRQLRPLTFAAMEELVASNMKVNLMPQDWKTLVELARLQAIRMDSESIDESMLIQHWEVKQIAFADDPAWTWNRVPFIPSATAPRGIWPDVLGRIETNAKPFLAWLYSLFVPDSSRVMAPWICGPGGTGKSKVAEAITKLLGTAALVKQAGKPVGRFDLWNVENARLIHFAEASANFCQSPNWKAVTGDNRIEIERKYGDSRIIELNAKFLITSNHFPEVTDQADMRRLILVPFGQISGTVLSGAEAEGALQEGMAWLMSEAKREYESDPECNRRDQSDLIALRDQGWDSDLFNRFFVPAQDCFVTASSLAEFFERQGWNATKAKEFRNAVSKAYPHIKPFSTAKRIDGKVVKVWSGLKWL